MNTDKITFMKVAPRRKFDCPTMILWAVIVNGEVVAYTDEPETLATMSPRVNNFEHMPQKLPKIHYSEFIR